MKPIFLSKSQREQLDLQRQNHQSKPQLESRSPKRARVDKLSEQERERKKQQLQAIKEQHLGYSTKPRTRVVKPSQKFRFSFDWDTSEDTSLDNDSLYQNPHEANPLFGRGFYAGMDRVEQKKTSSAKNEVVNQHWTKKNLGEMTERDWRIFREDFGISYKGSYSSSKYIIPHPIRTWKESELSENILKAVEKAGYKKPSPIQMAAIPVGLRRCDTIGVAETGSGKTAAFLLPMLDYVSKQPLVEEDNETAGPHVVVLVPTHELAQQIEKEVVKLARYLDGVRVVSIVGGKSIQEQAFSFRKGCEVIIATPGRLIDCLEQRYVVLNQCNYVILDEADRMIDLGFEPQIVRVLDALPSSNLKPDSEEVDGERVYRSTFMFSATMPPGVERLARKYLRNPVVVTVGTAGKAADVITQRVIMMKESEKKVKLKKLIDEIGDNRVIVFANSRTNVDTVAKDLDRGGYNVTTLRGGMSQEQREISLEGFKTRKYNVLVATDVAGRGIDIPDVAHVINYEMPGKIEMYMHRIGRTGRAGKKGVATTFLTLSDSNVFYDLKHVLIQSNCHVPHELASHGASKVMPGTIPERPSRYGTALDH